MSSKIDASVLAARIRELFDYDQENGNFIRKFQANCTDGQQGSIAGSLKKDGQIWIRIDGIKYTLHRLAWLYMTGSWPEAMIDHKDLDNTNNAWSNLRECTNGQNQMNTGPQSNNKLGVKNVHRMKNGRFMACVGKDKKYHQKTFRDLESAASWADAKRKELHGEFARGEK
jgi:AP2 domain.